MPVKKTKAYTRLYTIKAGDTMVSMSMDLYGTAAKWRLLADINGIRNVRKIKPGQQIRY